MHLADGLLFGVVETSAITIWARSGAIRPIHHTKPDEFGRCIQAEEQLGGDLDVGSTQHCRSTHRATGQDRHSRDTRVTNNTSVESYLPPRTVSTHLFQNSPKVNVTTKARPPDALSASARYQ